MSDLGNFARQVPIGHLLMPVILGALYIGAMVYIVTRARRRREQTRLEVETGRRVARGEIRAEEAAQRVAPPKPTLNLSAMIACN